jgi:hypothetical protein
MAQKIILFYKALRSDEAGQHKGGQRSGVQRKIEERSDRGSETYVHHGEKIKPISKRTSRLATPLDA